MAQQQLLLLEDVEKLGRSGDIVKVKPGFARNYLLPRGAALVATKGALLRQKRLQEERAKKAAEDKATAEAVAKVIEGAILTTVVKTDPEGHMYGSVSVADIANMLLEQKSATVEKKQIALKHPIKTTGVHEVQINLPEGVTALIHVKIETEQMIAEAEAAEAAAAEASEEEGSVKGL